MKPIATDDRIRRYVDVKNTKSPDKARQVANEYVATSDDPDWLYWDYYIVSGKITVAYIRNEGEEK